MSITMYVLPGNPYVPKVGDVFENERGERVMITAVGEAGTICPQCGATSTLRPSGDRVCGRCGYAWEIGEIRKEPPKP